MQGIRGLLFDKDGTLFDFQKTWGAWASRFLHDLSTHGPTPEQLAKRIGYDIERQTYHPDSVAIAGTIVEVATALSKDLPALSLNDIVQQANQAAVTVEQVEAVPLKPYLSGLQTAGYKLGVSTNDAETSAISHLQSKGILEFFDLVLGYDSGFGAKPEPGMQLAFCKAMALEPAQVLMIGDSTHDLTAGKAAGMQTIGVLTGVAGRDELAPHADLVIDHIGLLPDALSRPK